MPQLQKSGELIKNGRVLSTVSKRVCRVKQLLGAGGQGEVYLVDFAGQDCALKWYYPGSATDEQKRILIDLIHKGEPNNKFLWPMELVEDLGVKGFGYLMNLRPRHYKSIVDLMKRRAEPSFYALCTATMQLADSFYQLHAKGLCYRDISFGNVFFDPDTGEILICDNDNVTTDGQTYSTVLGTPSFMAPEVVVGTAVPSADTDRFSLAVLLFYMLMLHHPLDGELEMQKHCKDAPAMRELYGEHPVFIFDPNDASNRPVKGWQDNALIYWEIYPEFVKQKFTQSFTAGLRDARNGRVMESKWRETFSRLRDSIIYCACGAECFYDPDKVMQGENGTCWSCGAALHLPPRIKLGEGAGKVVMLNNDTCLYPHHTDENRQYDFSNPVAEVIQHPEKPGVWGIKNLTDTTWSITGASQSMTTVEPGRSVTMSSGLKINFGTLTGEIRA